MNRLIVESSVWAVAEQTGWLVLKAQPCPELRDWDGRVFCTRAAEPCSKCNDTRVVSPLVPADCLPHPCPNCGGSGIGSDYQGSVTTCGYRRQFEKSGAIVLGWTCPEHINDCPRATFVDDGPCGTCGGSGTVAEPFHLGTEQVSTNYVAAHWSPWTVSSNPKWNYKVDVKFRQALLATAVITSQPIPVMHWRDWDFADECITIGDDHPAGRYWWNAPGGATDITDVLGGLVSPGDVVVRVELTPLEEPITHYMGNTTGRGSDGPDWTPLDLPLGVFTKEEQ